MMFLHLMTYLSELTLFLDSAPWHSWSYSLLGKGGWGQRSWPQLPWPWLFSQDRDFEPLRPGEPIFKLFSGEDVLYEGNSVVYPVFINEAAYYEKHVAFLKSEKIRVSVPALPELTSSSTLAP